MIFILKNVIGALIGYILDLHFRFLAQKETKITRWGFLKLLTNIPVYGSGFLLLSLLALIPIFDRVVFMVLYVLVGGLICNMVELAWGYLLNIKLKLNICDYDTKIMVFGKNINFTIMRQTDLLHYFMFIGLSLFALFYDKVISFMSNILG